MGEDVTEVSQERWLRQLERRWKTGTGWRDVDIQPHFRYIRNATDCCSELQSEQTTRVAVTWEGRCREVGLVLLALVLLQVRQERALSEFVVSSSSVP